jgi:UDP-N-acetylmuramate dehydrogenase
VASTLIDASVLQSNGMIARWPAQRFAFAYRSSILKRENPDAARHPAILEASFGLQTGSRPALEARIAEYTAQRKRTQPPGATCGSVFKNPPGDYAGRLIEAAGLKGRQLGGAQISQVHANFIRNQGGATAADIRGLMAVARQEVMTRFGVKLEPEIELIGEWEGEKDLGKA